MNPMTPTTGIAALALASLVMVGPSFAAESTAPNTTRETAAPAKKAADGTTLTLNADPAVAPQLRDLKKGERVKVTYKKSNGQQVATKVTPA